jgi:BirA family biotin operon repressor/biotin-[acetyl-CoA-carboxylase] ligase
LLEVGGEATGPCHVVVGLGLNIHLPEAQTLAIEQPWVDLASIAHTLPSQRNHIAALLISELIEAMAVYGESGLASFTEDWSRFDHFQGEQVMLRMGSQDIRGIYQGINQNGAMRLLIDGQSRCYNAGEISLCRAVA